MSPKTVGEVRREVLALDHHTCVATRLDLFAGPCFDQWGKPFSGFDASGDRLEVDRVTDEPMLGSNSEDDIPAHLDVTRQASLCPGHHRGTGPNKGRQWATANRQLLRDYLARRNLRYGLSGHTNAG